MNDSASSWRIIAVCAIVVLVGLAGLFHLVALLRTQFSMMGILRREHAGQKLAPEDFDAGWAWYLYRLSAWLMIAAAGLVLLLLVTRVLSRV